jgi:L,D-transpeptidase ErfK/SrfK
VTGTAGPAVAARLLLPRFLPIFLLLVMGAVPGEEAPGTGSLVGGEFSYTVERGDSLALIGARFGEDPGRIARDNGLAPSARLSLAQRLRVENRHVVPRVVGEGVVINIPQRLLFFFSEGALASWYPVALGRRDWQTPTGLFAVVNKRNKPAWHVPASIQEEMRRKGQRVRTVVPPGPDNPLGDHWIGLSGSFCGIHGTNAPSSIYGFRTHGCVRLHPEDVSDLFSRVSIGTPVEVIYEPVLLARQPDGAIFLEANPDAYGRPGDLRAAFEALAAREKLSELIDPARVDAVLKRREGVASPIHLPAAATPLAP